MISSDLSDPHGIRKRRSALGWTERDLARRAGVPYQRVQALERASPAGKTPYSRYLSEVIKALDVGEGSPSAGIPPNTRFGPSPVTGEMPVYAKRPNQSGGMELTGLIAGWMRVPRQMANVTDGYGVQVWSSNMAPKYRPKDILIVNPQSPPRREGGVIVMSEDRSDVCIGEYVGETEEEWIIERFGNSPEVKHLPKSEYPVIHAIVCVSTDLISI